MSDTQVMVSTIADRRNLVERCRYDLCGRAGRLIRETPSLFFLLLVTGLLSLGACNPKVHLPDDADQAASPVDGTDPPTGADASATATDRDAAAPPADPNRAVYGPLPTCEQPSGLENRYSSAADTEARIEGVWVLCSGYLFAPADSAGLELTKGKGRLLLKEGDALVTTADPEYQVAVTLPEDSAASQVNFQYRNARVMTRLALNGFVLALLACSTAEQAGADSSGTGSATSVRAPAQHGESCRLSLGAAG